MRSVLTAVLLAGLAPAPGAAQKLASQRHLRVTFVGNLESPRGVSFLRFLELHFEHARGIQRSTCTPADVAGSDVMILDWPQQEGVSQWIRDKSKKPVTPFGERSAWATPTVLVGSAGLNLAAAWEVKGGFG